MSLVARVRFLVAHAIPYANDGSAFHYSADDRALVDVDVAEGLIAAGVVDFLDVPAQSIDGVEVAAPIIAAAAQRLADVEPPPVVEAPAVDDVPAPPQEE